MAPREPHLLRVRLVRVALAELLLARLAGPVLLTVVLEQKGLQLLRVRDRPRRVVPRHVPGVDPQRVFGVGVAIKRGLEAHAALVQRERVPEDTDGVVGLDERKGRVRDDAHRADCVPVGGRRGDV